MTLGPPPSYDASALSSHNQHGINDDLPRYDHTSSLDIKEKEKGDDNAKENGLGRIRSALSMNDRTGSSFGSGSGSIPSSKGWLARKKEERDQRKAKKIEEDRAEGEAMIARINARMKIQRDTRQEQIDEWVMKRAQYGEEMAGPAPIPYYKDKDGIFRPGAGRSAIAMGGAAGAGFLGLGGAMIYTGGDFSGGGGGFSGEYEYKS